MNDTTNVLDANLTQQQPQEKLVPQSVVNELIRNKSGEAAAKTRAEVQAEYEAKIRDMQAAQSQQASNPAASPQTTAVLDPETIYQQATERLTRHLQQKQAEDEMNRVATNYLSKMGEGPKQYDDFNEVMKDYDPTAFPQVTYLLSGMDEAAGINRELAMNPQKLVYIDRLAEKNPKMAQAELMKLGRSISDNRQAVQADQEAQTNAPLDRLTQSARVSTGSNGKQSIGDLRKMSWLRG